jgi:hypothetical protein
MDTMQFSAVALGFLIIAGAAARPDRPARERSHLQPIAWYYVQEGPLEIAQKAVGRRTRSLSLGRGTLAPVMKIESKNGSERALLRITDLETLNPVEGWAKYNKENIIPLERFPSDEDLLRQLKLEPANNASGGGAGMVRWLVKQGNSGIALVCFVPLFGLPDSRLAAFLPHEGGFRLGASLDFPFFDLKPGIVSGEVRDLLGDGDECLITHEPFRAGPATFGVNMVIRRLEQGNFVSLWKAPLESQNLEFFPREVQILQPLEKNAGAPGTVTKSEVEFQPRGKVDIPVWKATVQFFGPGQDKPLESVKVLKACDWNGSQFEPVR